MFSNRRTCLATVLVALVSLLFMQLAVAASACPAAGAKGAAVAASAAMTDASMPCAEPMAPVRDDAQPNLCQAHCQAGLHQAG